jgi:hypothetical protein
MLGNSYIATCNLSCVWAAMPQSDTISLHARHTVFRQPLAERPARRRLLPYTHSRWHRRPALRTRRGAPALPDGILDPYRRFLHGRAMSAPPCAGSYPVALTGTPVGWLEHSRRAPPGTREVPATVIQARRVFYIAPQRTSR